MQPVTALHHIAGVDRLAAVCDGNLLLLDPESLKEWHMPGAKVRLHLPQPWHICLHGTHADDSNMSHDAHEQHAGHACRVSLQSL